MYWVIFIILYGVMFWAYGEVQQKDGIKRGVREGFLVGYEMGRKNGAWAQLEMLDPKHQYKLWLEAQQAKEREAFKQAKKGWMS